MASASTTWVVFYDPVTAQVTRIDHPHDDSHIQHHARCGDAVGWRVTYMRAGIPGLNTEHDLERANKAVLLATGRFPVVG